MGATIENSARTNLIDEMRLLKMSIILHIRCSSKTHDTRPFPGQEWTADRIPCTASTFGPLTHQTNLFSFAWQAVLYCAFIYFIFCLRGRCSINRILTISGDVVNDVSWSAKVNIRSFLMHDFTGNKPRDRQTTPDSGAQKSDRSQYKRSDQILSILSPRHSAMRCFLFRYLAATQLISPYALCFDSLKKVRLL